jgi:hypothetical protein
MRIFGVQQTTLQVERVYSRHEHQQRRLQQDTNLLASTLQVSINVSHHSIPSNKNKQINILANCAYSFYQFNTFILLPLNSLTNVCFAPCLHASQGTTVMVANGVEIPCPKGCLAHGSCNYESGELDMVN